MTKSGKRATQETLNYLSDEILSESELHEEEGDWFGELAEFVGHLPLSDELASRLTEYLTPFLDDDDRLDGTMYPTGAAFEYFESAAAGGVMRDYLIGFTDALQTDYLRWTAFQAEVGPEYAEWRLNSEPTKSR